MSSTKYYSSKQENMIANFLGWSVVPGSGARSLYPGDIQSDEWLGECKTHENPGHKITFYHSVWKKLSDEAISKFKFPALFVDDGSQSIFDTWVMFYHVMPSGSYREVAFPFSIKNNIGFKSLDMMNERRKFSEVDPVIFVVGLDNKEVTTNISTLKDFAFMFGSTPF